MADITTETIGTILDDNAQRDAVHIALAPVVASTRMPPGAPVGLLEDGRAGFGVRPIGIVDPFLDRSVEPGERFWLFLYPMTITSLRHEWTHPAFSREDIKSLRPDTDADNRTASEKWLREFVARSDCPDYETVVATAIGKGSQQWDLDCLHFDGQDAHGEIPPEFWIHIENVTGVRIPRDRRATYFSCSC